MYVYIYIYICMYIYIYIYMYVYTRCDGMNNKKKLCDFISIVVPQKKIFVFAFGVER